MNDNEMKKNIEEQIEEFREDSYFAGDMNGTMASIIEEERMIDKLKELYDVLYFFRQPGNRNMKHIVEGKWDEFQKSMEILHKGMDVYMQVIDGKIQKEGLTDEENEEDIDLRKPVYEKDEKINEGGAWKVRMNRGVPKDYPEWVRKEIIKLSLDYRGRLEFNEEIVEDGDLFVKIGDDIRLLKQDENRSDSWIA